MKCGSSIFQLKYFDIKNLKVLILTGAIFNLQAQNWTAY